MKVKVEVYHKEAVSDAMKALGVEQEFTHVATVNAPDDQTYEHQLEYAWRWTNNIDGSWSRGPHVDGCDNPDYNSNVTVHASLHVHNGKTYGLRSSMIGDKFVIDGTAYYCDLFGFKKGERVDD